MTSRDSGSCEGIENRRLVSFARCSEVINNGIKKSMIGCGSYGVHIILEFHSRKRRWNVKDAPLEKLKHLQTIHVLIPWWFSGFLGDPPTEPTFSGHYP